MSQKTDKIYEEAAKWVARSCAESFSASDEAVRDAWFAKDARHFGAYMHLQAVLAMVDIAKESLHQRFGGTIIPEKCK